jgi:hypothetical protein
MVHSYVHPKCRGKGNAGASQTKDSIHCGLRRGCVHHQSVDSPIQLVSWTIGVLQQESCLIGIGLKSLTFFYFFSDFFASIHFWMIVESPPATNNGSVASTNFCLQFKTQQTIIYLHSHYCQNKKCGINFCITKINTKKLLSAKPTQFALADTDEIFILYSQWRHQPIGSRLPEQMLATKTSREGRSFF